MSFRKLFNPIPNLSKRIIGSGWGKTHVVFDHQEKEMVRNYLKILNQEEKSLQSMTNQTGELEMMIAEEKKARMWVTRKKRDLSQRIVAFGITNKGKTVFSHPKDYFARFAGWATGLNPFFYASLVDFPHFSPMYFLTVSFGMLFYAGTPFMMYLLERHEVLKVLNHVRNNQSKL